MRRRLVLSPVMGYPRRLSARGKKFTERAARPCRRRPFAVAGASEVEQVREPALYVSPGSLSRTRWAEAPRGLVSGAGAAPRAREATFSALRAPPGWRCGSPPRRSRSGAPHRGRPSLAVAAAIPRTSPAARAFGARLPTTPGTSAVAGFRALAGRAAGGFRAGDDAARSGGAAAVGGRLQVSRWL